MAPFSRICVFAPAKVNLTLHVTGRRADGFHLLDSLVLFADVGDHLEIRPDQGNSLDVTGPEASELSNGGDNLVLKVANLIEDALRFSFKLEKKLPVSAGIGGGSADAAAAFRGLVAARHDVNEIGSLAQAFSAPLLSLGADIPMCIQSKPFRVKGIGGDLRALDDLPLLHAVLVNPRRAVSTPAVFKALTARDNPPMPSILPRFSGSADLISWLATQRNDLESPAMYLEPAIAEAKKVLSDTADCRLVRMSGSGATCFGLYASAVQARDAAFKLKAQYRDWWIEATALGTQADRAAPRFR